MFLFVAVPLFLFLFSRKIKLPSVLFPVTVLFLSIILGFRGTDVGVDTHTYSDYYDYVGTGGSDHMEIGWNILCITSKNIGLNFHEFTFFVACLTMLCFSIPMRRLPSNQGKYFGLFFFMCFGYYILMFNGMRQFLAVSLCFLSYMLLEDGKIAKSLLLVIGASFIHTSALIVIPVILLLTKVNRLDLRTILVLLMISFLIGLCVNERFLSLFSGKYSSYLFLENAFRTKDIAYLLLIVLPANAFMVYSFINAPYVLKNSYWMKLFFVSTLVLNVLQKLLIGPRIVYYFSVSEIIVVSLLALQNNYHMNRGRVKTYKIISFAYAIITYIRFLIGEVNLDYGGVIPYSMQF